MPQSRVSIIVWRHRIAEIRPWRPFSSCTHWLISIEPSSWRARPPITLPSVLWSEIVKMPAATVDTATNDVRLIPSCDSTVPAAIRYAIPSPTSITTVGSSIAMAGSIKSRITIAPRCTTTSAMTTSFAICSHKAPSAAPYTSSAP